MKALKGAAIDPESAARSAVAAARRCQGLLRGSAEW